MAVVVATVELEKAVAAAMLVLMIVVVVVVVVAAMVVLVVALLLLAVAVVVMEVAFSIAVAGGCLLYLDFSISSTIPRGYSPVVSGAVCAAVSTVVNI